MKVEIIIDDSLEETCVKIYSKEYTSEIEDLKEKIMMQNKDIISAFKDDKVFLIKANEIYRIYSQDQDVFIESKDDLFKSKLRLYEFEKILNKKRFVKISRSEIINLSHVKKLDLSFLGSICVEMKNGKISYVSRRNIKKFKESIGL
ncbi:LytTR family transcriptional regulator [Peptoniphilus sp. GNH]|nr:LytTr DNA-binding domain protein [Clostridiales bacterium KA00134]UHR02988.1 LytTR family transcriptional regulator [Peptoniphilus sp. GNH]